MTRGRKPLPAEQHRLHGNPGKRSQPEPWKPPGAVYEQELAAGRDAHGRPNPPATLGEIAAGEWSRLLELYYGTTITDGDLGTLYQCCEAFEDAVHAQSDIRRDGRMIPYRKIEKHRKDGSVEYIEEGIMRHPMFPVKDQARTAYHKLASSLGINPSQRSRVDRLDKGEKDDEDLLAGRSRFRVVPGGQDGA